MNSIIELVEKIDACSDEDVSFELSHFGDKSAFSVHVTDSRNREECFMVGELKVFPYRKLFVNAALGWISYKNTQLRKPKTQTLPEVDCMIPAVMNTQEIFNRVIQNNLYPENKQNGKSSNYMCNALDRANAFNVISVEEHKYAKIEILKYLGSYTLKGFLEYRNLPCSKSDMLAVYMNWDARPQQ